MNKIEKVLNRDKERAIQSALREKYDEDYPWVFEIDTDKSEAYFEMYKEGSGYSTWMVTYSLNADQTSATITSDEVEVVSQTEYKEITKSQEDGIVSRVLKGLVDHFGGTTKEAPPVETVPFIKQFQDEEMIAIEALYIEPDGVDGHGWTADAGVLREMTESCNNAIQEGRLLCKYNHSEETDDFYFIKAWVNECDCYIGDKFVPEGQPMIKSKFTNTDAWERRKAGETAGVSIGARGVWEEIVEED